MGNQEEEEERIADDDRVDGSTGESEEEEETKSNSSSSSEQQQPQQQHHQLPHCNSDSRLFDALWSELELTQAPKLSESTARSLSFPSLSNLHEHNKMGSLRPAQWMGNHGAVVNVIPHDHLDAKNR